MKISVKSAVLGIVVAFAASSAFAAHGQLILEGGGNNVTLSGDFAPASPEAAAAKPEIADGSVTYSLFATTTADILLVDAQLEVRAGSWYNAGAADLGSDTNPPNPALFAAFPALRADSWVTTPNAASASAGTNTLEGGNMVTHFDSTDDGPQTDFQFAQITMVPDSTGNYDATLTGVIQTAASPTPIFDNFSATMNTVVPEPATMGLILSALLGCLAIVRKRS